MWLRSYKEIKLLLSSGKWVRSYRVTNQHPSLPSNFITHGFLDPSAFPDSGALNPDPPILAFFDFLSVFVLRFVSPFLHASFLFRGFWGFRKEKNPRFFRGFPCSFPKKARAGGSGKLTLKLFGRSRNAKTPGYSTKKFGLPGFRRTYRTFWPSPLHVEDPHPTRRYPDQKVWVWVPSSSLKKFYRECSIWGSKVQVFEAQLSGRVSRPCGFQCVLNPPYPNLQRTVLMVLRTGKVP